MIINTGSNKQLLINPDLANKIQDEISNETLKLTDVRVLMFVMSVIDNENKVAAYQPGIAKALDIASGRAGASLKKLVDIGFIKIDEMIGNTKTYKANKRYFIHSQHKDALSS